MKAKYIMLMFVLLILLLPGITALTYFPPAEDWDQGYWDATVPLTSASKTNASMIFNIYGGAGDGDEIYYVSDSPWNLSYVTHIRVTWKASFGAAGGAFVLGIDTDKNTKNFVTNTSKTSSFSITNTSLDVTDYYGSYYIKIGGYTESGGIGDVNHLWVYNITGYDRPYSIPLQPTSIEETTATLRGYVIDDGGSDCTCGFWVLNTSTFDEGSLQANLTSGIYNTGDIFTYNYDGFTSADYYYVLSWIKNDYSFNVSRGYYYNFTGDTWTNISFPETIWSYNSSMNVNSSPRSFSINGTLLQQEEYIQIYNVTPGTLWISTRPEAFNNLYEIGANNYYRFYVINRTRLFFNYDKTGGYYEPFIMKPHSPSSLSVTATHARAIDLTWTNASIPANTNHSVLIHYSTSSPVGSPTPGTWGTYGANESSLNTATINGLNEDTTYYFVAWTYVNASGSESKGKFSSEFVTTSGTTEGGIYNITVRYENESEGGNVPVNLSHWRIHKFIIHYDTSTDIIEFDNGVASSTIYGYFDEISTGNFSFETNDTVKYIEFHWNSSVDALKHCYRVQVVDSGQRDVTFYIRTDLPVYGEGTTKEYHIDAAPVVDHTSDLTIDTTYEMDEIYAVYIYNISVYPMWEEVPSGNYTIGTNQIVIDSEMLNANTTMGKVEYYTYSTVTGVVGPLEDTLIRYTYKFLDNTLKGYFISASPQNAWAEVYLYNATIKLSIHKEYWSANDEIYPWLVFNKKYRVGVGCDAVTIPLIGIAPTGAETSPEAMLIADPGNISYAFFEIIDITAGWNAPGSGFWVHYNDTDYRTNSVTFRVWDSNGTLVYSSTSDQSYVKFTYASAGDIFKYNWTITTNHSEWLTNQTVEGAIYPGMTPITDITSFNDLITKILGNTPLQNVDPYDPLGRYGQTVSWSPIIIGIIALILALSFGAYNAYVGMISGGLVLTFGFGAVENIPVAFLYVGLFLVGMAIVFALGGKYK